MTWLHRHQSDEEVGLPIVPEALFGCDNACHLLVEVGHGEVETAGGRDAQPGMRGLDGLDMDVLAADQDRLEDVAGLAAHLRQVFQV